MNPGAQKTTVCSQQFEDVCIEDLFSSYALPWNKISGMCPNCVNDVARVLGIFLKKCIYFIYTITIILLIYSIGMRLRYTYIESYTKTNCSEYYVFDVEKSDRFCIQYPLTVVQA